MKSNKTKTPKNSKQNTKTVTEIQIVLSILILKLCHYPTGKKKGSVKPINFILSSHRSLKEASPQKERNSLLSNHNMNANINKRTKNPLTILYLLFYFALVGKDFKKILPKLTFTNKMVQNNKKEKLVAQNTHMITGNDDRILY